MDFAAFFLCLKWGGHSVRPEANGAVRVKYMGEAQYAVFGAPTLVRSEPPIGHRVSRLMGRESSVLVVMSGRFRYI